MAHKNALEYVENAFFFCPSFLEVFGNLFFGRCRFGTSRKHYKNRGFGAWVVKVEKNEILSKYVCVLRQSARFRHAFGFAR